MFMGTERNISGCDSNLTVSLLMQ